MRMAFSALLLVCACTPAVQGDGEGGVRLAAMPTSARDSIVLTLTNGSGREVGYNLCTSALERRAGDDWEAVPTDRICTMELRTLAPGGTASFTTALPPGTNSGDYRFTATVEAGERQAVHSNIVRVTP